jgi:type VI secretion system protein ImpE
VLEVIVNGRYAWLPFADLRQLRIEPPEDLRDLVWAPAQISFANGGETVALIPTRYAPFNTNAPEAEMLSRRTDWLPLDAGHFAGRGHRVLATSADELPLLQWREFRFDPPSP